jgi:hypothetical protein
MNDKLAKLTEELSNAKALAEANRKRAADEKERADQAESGQRAMIVRTLMRVVAALTNCIIRCRRRWSKREKSASTMRSFTETLEESKRCARNCTMILKT